MYVSIYLLSTFLVSTFKHLTVLITHVFLVKVNSDQFCSLFQFAIPILFIEGIGDVQGP